MLLKVRGWRRPVEDTDISGCELLNRPGNDMGCGTTEEKEEEEEGEEEEEEAFIFKLWFIPVSFHSTNAPYSLSCHSKHEKWAH